MTDYKGVEYDSLAGMCRAYGIPESSYLRRIKIGWTQEEALTTPPESAGDGERCTDHNGKEFRSERAMCKAYGVPYAVYEMRLRFGWSLKDALEKKP